MPKKSGNSDPKPLSRGWEYPWLEGDMVWIHEGYGVWKQVSKYSERAINLLAFFQNYPKEVLIRQRDNDERRIRTFKIAQSHRVRVTDHKYAELLGGHVFKLIHRGRLSGIDVFLVEVPEPCAKIAKTVEKLGGFPVPADKGELV